MSMECHLVAAVNLISIKSGPFRPMRATCASIPRALHLSACATYYIFKQHLMRKIYICTYTLRSRSPRTSFSGKTNKIPALENIHAAFAAAFVNTKQKKPNVHLGEIKILTHTEREKKRLCTINSRGHIKYLNFKA